MSGPRKRLRAAEIDSMIEVFRDRLDREMDSVVAAGVPAERVRIAAEETAINWEPPKRRRRNPTGTGTAS